MSLTVIMVRARSWCPCCSLTPEPGPAGQLEISGDLQMLLPIMVCILLAKSVGETPVWRVPRCVSRADAHARAARVSHTADVFTHSLYHATLGDPPPTAHWTRLSSLTSVARQSSSACRTWTSRPRTSAWVRRGERSAQLDGHAGLTPSAPAHRPLPGASFHGVALPHRRRCVQGETPRRAPRRWLLPHAGALRLCAGEHPCPAAGNVHPQRLPRHIQHAVMELVHTPHRGALSTSVRERRSEAHIAANRQEFRKTLRRETWASQQQLQQQQAVPGSSGAGWVMPLPQQGPYRAEDAACQGPKAVPGPHHPCAAGDASVDERRGDRSCVRGISLTGTRASHAQEL